MTKYERKWKCACCDDLLIYDDEKHTLTCNCGVIEDYDPTGEVLRAAFRLAFLVNE